MQAFTTHTGTVAPLRRSNVDTDSIVPAAYLKRITRTGFEDGLFAAWRRDPRFVLNVPEYAGASILVAGSDFGTGSSREHAVWALLDYGFRAVLSPRFGDIFRTNSGKAGLLAAEVDESVIAALWQLAEAEPAATVTVDLESRMVVSPTLSAPFRIDDHTRGRLLRGLDDIAVTLGHEAAIASYEENRPTFAPSTPLAVRSPSGVSRHVGAEGA